MGWVSPALASLVIFDLHGLGSQPVWPIKVTQSSYEAWGVSPDQGSPQHQGTEMSIAKFSQQQQHTTNRRSVRYLASVAAASIGVGLGAGLVTAPSALASNTSERQTGAYVNSSRQHYNRRALTNSADLNAVARSWANYMASHNRLAHNPNLRSQVRGWRYVGENVGVGSSSSVLHSAFMKSPGHRANILDSDFTQSGYGAAYAHGRLWVVEIFRQPTTTSRSSSSSSHSSSDRSFGYRSRGSTVKKVQKRLGVRQTGYFGRKTLRAVRSFQSRNHLPVTGRVDSRTRRAMRI